MRTLFNVVKLFYLGEDQLKFMVSKQTNQTYKPWKNKYAPKNPQSPFGDFPIQKEAK